jgi:hypothetical protein
MMQRYLFAVSVLIALSGMASAADMPDPGGAASLLPAPELNWTGTRQIALTPRVPGLPVGLVDITQSTNLARVGINYRFGFAR